jgi:predicted DsbA family dithiol-disulfide isomerase
VGQAEQKAEDYRVPGVPALTIAGKYMVEGGDHAKMLSTSDQLIAMERAGGKRSEK